ncbi:Thioredoxin reductase [Paramicrobacterium humi]|uniref:Thioredoxin reductase n=1 Tax=Paramicrobacterium humi TaxID=640635 RepID=A0A1H4KNQ1_9MICO|nr:NAD(P)/FAD-dependent oxidoreductase [Microbacterium humi]SEB60164.1 Thioredoxin reductase [Microbacterium humi]
MNTTHDVVIVGGSAAGLSAAVTLARSLRSVVVIDGGQPRNAPAEGAHNLLGHEGITPSELLGTGRREAEGYGAAIIDDTVTTARRTDRGFELDLASGGTVSGRRLLLATGLVDELPDVPGVRQFWGSSVLHCPFCHGWEVRGQRIGILSGGPRSLHQTMLFRQLSEHVTYFVNETEEPDDAGWETLAALGVPVVTGRVARLRGEDRGVRAVVLEDGHEFAVDAVAVAPRFMARTELFEQLGGQPSEHPMGGRYIPTEQGGRTSVDGVWAAGNAADVGAVLGASAASGVVAAGALHADLLQEDLAAAIAARAA